MFIRIGFQSAEVAQISLRVEIMKMNPSSCYINICQSYKRDHRSSALSAVWLFAALFFALSPSAAAARPAIVLGSFTEESNASAMLETLARRDDLAGISLTLAANDTGDNTNSKRPFIRVVAYAQDPSQTRALLGRMRENGFTKAWYMRDARIENRSNVLELSNIASPVDARPSELLGETISARSSNSAAVKGSEIQTVLSSPGEAATADKVGLHSKAAINYPVSETIAPMSRAVDNTPAQTGIASKAVAEIRRTAHRDDPISSNTKATLDGQVDAEQQGQEDRNDEAKGLLKSYGLFPTLRTVKNVLAHESLQWSLDHKTTQDSLPNSDLKHPYFGEKSSSSVADLHLEWQQRFDNVTLSFDHVLQWNGGDVISWSRTPYGAPELRSLDDRPRMFDLTTTLTDGDHHRLHSHFRELMVRWEGKRWNAGIGRDTINWGTGIVFHPMGLFNSLPPLHVYGDDQVGQDHIMIERLWSRDASPTNSLSFLHVGRRITQGVALSEDVSTTALKWHLKSEDYAIGVTAAHHYDATFIGLEAASQFGNVTVSSNLTLRERDRRYSNSSWGLTGVVNVRYSSIIAALRTLRTSFSLGKPRRRLDISTPTAFTASVFAEFFHNGFGLKELPESYINLPADLSDQLARQEAFTFMRDYIAVGGELSWSDSLTQNVTLISNLHDPSPVVRAEFSYAFRDYLRINLGLITPISDDGKEFTPQQIGTTRDGRPVTWGSDRQVYLRWEFRR